MFSIWRTFSDVMRPTSASAREASRRVCEASALVVLALMLSGRGAQASCGDYVHVEGRSANHVGDMAAEAFHSAPASRESGSPVCQGPHCRRQRPPAAPENPVSFKAGFNEWLDWRATVEERDQRLGALLGQILPGLASGHYRALERPPR
jgi:hypothetical protein